MQFEVYTTIFDKCRGIWRFNPNSSCLCL